jgi:nicotinamide mononucleotide transporter
MLPDQARAFSTLEIIAVVTALLYLVLAIRENIWCWPSALISTAIYVYLFFDARLYMESVLNIFYFAIAIYGWYVWYFGRTEGQELAVTRWPIRIHAIVISLVIVVSIANGYLLQRYSNAAFPYIDSITTWAAIWATFLVARKVLENWWYWLVIDAVLVFIYWARDLQLTTMLFVLYLIMVPFGLVSWTRSWREARA